MDMLHTYTDMIDLNPLVEERHPIKPPPHATAEEYHCWWYSLTDRVQYLPGIIITTKVSYTACFHDLSNGLQAHYYAPLGLNIKNKWTLCGSLPGETTAPVEIGVGAPHSGLYLREDIKMTCNFMATAYVKKILKKAHATLISRLVARAQFIDVRSTQILPEQESENISEDYEPIEFGRDGQNTSDPINDVQSLFHARIPLAPSKYHQAMRPLSYYGEETKTSERDSLSLNNAISLNTELPNHVRNTSPCSAVASKSSWPNSISQLRNSVVDIDPGNQEVYYELDTNEKGSPNNNMSHIAELSTETEVRREPIFEKLPINDPISKQTVFTAVEMEGSIPV